MLLTVTFDCVQNIKQSGGCHAKGSSCLRGVKLLYLSWIHQCWTPGGEKRAKPSRLWHICPLPLARMSHAVRFQSIDRPPVFYYPKLWAATRFQPSRLPPGRMVNMTASAFSHMMHLLAYSLNSSDEGPAEDRCAMPARHWGPGFHFQDWIDKKISAAVPRLCWPQ